MTGAEHYREAERLLRDADEIHIDIWEGEVPSGEPREEPRWYEHQRRLTEAQVHATLAVAAAQATSAVVAACRMEYKMVRAGRGDRLDEVTRQEIGGWDDALGGVPGDDLDDLLDDGGDQ
ncbi:hypothetical protein [Gordonia sp. (in: high G+C Gram-positive bacteria)]|uniref:hypothetical protein n=1 Tax=Gordonia sp. (in: high G+C Gram-positive bacteria) TaxID=84139 RepID=UPI002601FA5A|nr:hypothetical protein [Gordonia sp. (in: high G+C Gram-positive bacteria)]